MLRKAKAFQLGLHELSQGRNPAERLITRDVEFTRAHVGRTMAARVRDYLGVSLDQQLAWRDDEEALKQWRQALYRVGIFVFKDAFREEGFSGFSLYDDVFPIIYVNNSAAKTRQIFTLFHELGHLLFHTSGIDPLDDGYVERLPDRPRHIEVLCNRFAAQFLLPEAAFEAAFAGQQADRTHGRNARAALPRQPRIHLPQIPRSRADHARRLHARGAKMGGAKAGRAAAAIPIGASLPISGAIMSPSRSINTIRTASTKRNSANISI